MRANGLVIFDKVAHEKAVETVIAEGKRLIDFRSQ